MAVDLKRFNGHFLICRKHGKELRNGVPTDGVEQMRRARSRPPRHRHPNAESAEKEATRLAALFPDTTFVIVQEIARAKVKATDVTEGAA